MIRILFLFLMALTLSHPVQAADKNKAPAAKQTAATEAPQPKPRTEAEEKKLAEKRKRVETKQTELNGSSWELALGSSDPKVKADKDTFTFQNGQFSSKNLMKRGFVATNYTVTVPSEESELAVWETMQTGGEGVVFIRGEWEKDKMSGNITEQLEGGKKVVEYYFSTNSRITIPPTSEKDKGPEGKAGPAGGRPGGSALVSKEDVAAFNPGTTDEATGK